MTVKKMYKALVNNFYIEKGESFSDEEIRRLYNQMIYDEQFIDEETGETHFLDEEEECTMKTNNTTPATNNNANASKEGTTMKKNTKIWRAETMISDAATYTKTSDENYITKDMLADMISDIMGNRPNTKKYRRDELIQDLKDIVDRYNASHKTKNTTPVPVGDLEITHDNAPEVVDYVAATVDNSEAKRKTNELFRLIKTHAIENHKKGYGHTISAYMLCAYILQAGHGIMKLKGHEHEITPEQKESVKSVRNWLIEKGWIKACTYKTTSNSIVYTDDYDGNDTHKARMIPINKSAGLTCEAVTSYKINW